MLTVPVSTRRTRAAAAALVAILAALLMSLPPAVFAQTLSNDATLSALTVSPKDIIGFASDRDSYDVGVASTVTQVTVTATPNHSGASVSYSGTDADDTTDGHQVTLSAGRNSVTITVTAEDASTQTYTVNVNQGVTDTFGWKASDDLDGLIAAGNIFPAGIWSDGATMWVADAIGDKLYAYRMSDKERDAGKDFDTLADAGNNTPVGIWSNGTTMWVADSGYDKLYAYRMSDKARDAGKDFDTLADAGNTFGRGIWSDGATMWVADSTDDKVYSYNAPPLSDDATLSALTLSPKDIIGFASDRDSYEVGVASTVTQVTVAATSNDAGARVAITPDDTDSVTTGHQVTLSAGQNTVTITVTAADSSTQDYTVNVNRGVTDPFGWKAADDFDGLIAAGNNSPTDIWSDDTTMWVIDSEDDEIYAYQLGGVVKITWSR